MEVLNLTDREPVKPWNKIKYIVKDNCKKRLPKTKKKKKVTWLSEQTTEIAKKRNQSQESKDHQEESNKEFQRAVTRDKKQEYSDICKSIHHGNKHRKIRKVFQKISNSQDDFPT